MRSGPAWRVVLPDAPESQYWRRLAGLDDEIRPSQVTLKTVFTVAFGVLIVITIVAAVVNAMLALALTGAALLIAVALDHPCGFSSGARSSGCPRSRS